MNDKKNNDFKIYEVGGYVRDSVLGFKARDKDYVIETNSFSEMREYVLANSKKVFLEKPELGIIRYLSKSGEAEDISLCVKSKSENGHILEIGTIFEDLENRDFTINAIARIKGSDELLDPFDGLIDIKNKTIRCVREPSITFHDDPARLIRSIRFKIKYDFSFDDSLSDYMYVKKEFQTLQNIDRERLRQELDKCFRLSADKALSEIYQLGNEFREVIFDHHKIDLNVR